jgi:hypothetical protein
VAATDEAAVEKLASGGRRKAVRLMTEATSNLTTHLMMRWKALEKELLVKYMDGNVKVQAEDGSYKTITPDGNIPVSPGHPAQRERWLRAIVNDHGETLKME